MTYLPSLFGENLMDDWMDDFDDAFFGRRNPYYGRHYKNLMKTDVKELGDSYELDVDLPGYKKEDLNLSLQDGYLTISAVKSVNNDKKDSEGHLIRQERFSGNIQRSFYVGDHVKEEDVKAKFEDGVLKLTVPKEDAKKAIEENKTITIE